MSRRHTSINFHYPETPNSCLHKCWHQVLSHYKANPRPLPSHQYSCVQGPGQTQLPHTSESVTGQEHSLELCSPESPRNSQILHPSKNPTKTKTPSTNTHIKYLAKSSNDSRIRQRRHFQTPTFPPALKIRSNARMSPTIRSIRRSFRLE